LRLRLDVDLLCDLYRVIDLDVEIPDGTLNLRVSQQELDRAQIASASIEEHRIRATQ
jgi:hypothetical protein